MGSIKARNGMDLTEAEDINKRWQEYTEALYKKDLHKARREPKCLKFLLALKGDVMEREVVGVLGD